MTEDPHHNRVCAHALAVCAGFLLAAPAQAGAPLEPARGVVVGITPDFSVQTPATLNATAGFAHAFFTVFTAFPPDYPDLNIKVAQIAGTRAALHLTPEPWVDLTTISDATIAAFAAQMSNYACGSQVPVLVRFGHEMNGDWYPWCGQPVRYTNAFARVARAVRCGGPNVGMVWAPSSGEGYPFGYAGMNLAAYLATDKPHGTAADFAAMDTNGNGFLDAGDDAFAPFYPGDEFVAWCGVTLYHWSWGGVNTTPSAGEFGNNLTGNGNWWRNLYQRFAADKHKPLLVAETGAMYREGWSGANNYDIKAGWMEQLYHADAATATAWSLPNDLPWLKAISWFDIRKYEAVAEGIVDWSISRYADTRDDYRGKLRQRVDTQRFFLNANDQHGNVYGWNGFGEGWLAGAPGSVVLCSTPAYEGSHALRVQYNGTGTQDAPVVARNNTALTDAPWDAAESASVYARVPSGYAAATLELVLQSATQGTNACGAQTVPADFSWHLLTWPLPQPAQLYDASLQTMFRLQCASNATRAVLLDALQVHAPSVLNAGFELPAADSAAVPAYWSRYNATRATDVVHSGSASLRINGGGWYNAKQTLNLAGWAGQQINADVYVRSPGLTGGHGALLKLQKPGTYDAYAEAWVLTPTSPPNTWVQGTVSAVLPADAVGVDVVLMLDGGDPPTQGTVYFDDLALSVPEPVFGLAVLFFLRVPVRWRNTRER
ncbi:MAG: hypothetical protein NTV22_15360 [bacterium]|nr:hypothetical protein [bacterium]